MPILSDLYAVDILKISLLDYQWICVILARRSHHWPVLVYRLPIALVLTFSGQQARTYAKARIKTHVKTRRQKTAIEV